MDSGEREDFKQNKQPENRVSENGFESGEEYVPVLEDFLPTPKTVPSGFELMPSGQALLPGAIFVALMCLFSISSWVYAGWSGSFTVTKDSIFSAHEFWRLITALFAHGDISHFAHNAPIFLFFSWILQGYFGWRASVLLPLAIGVISNGATVYFYENHVQLLGASGMIYGMVSLWLTLYIRYDRNSDWPKKVVRSLGFSLLILFPQTYDAKVSYLAHFSGFVTGILLGVVFGGVLGKGSPVMRDFKTESSQI